MDVYAAFHQRYKQTKKNTSAYFLPKFPETCYQNIDLPLESKKKKKKNVLPALCDKMEDEREEERTTV